MVVSPSSSRPLSITTSTAASFEIEAIGRSCVGIVREHLRAAVVDHQRRARLDVRLAALDRGHQPLRRHRPSCASPPWPLPGLALAGRVRRRRIARDQEARHIAVQSAIRPKKRGITTIRVIEDAEDEGKFPNLRLIGRIASNSVPPAPPVLEPQHRQPQHRGGHQHESRPSPAPCSTVREALEQQAVAPARRAPSRPAATSARTPASPRTAAPARRRVVRRSASSASTPIGPRR